MLFKSAIAAFALTGLVSAAPRKEEPRVLGHDDVVLPRADGGFDIMKDWEWSHLERRLEKEARDRAMEEQRRALAGETIPAGANLGLGRRGCEESEEVQVLTDTSFTDWDVAMSPVVAATGGGATVAVSEGYMVADALTVGASVDLTLIKDVLKVGYSVSTTQTWTTTDTQTFTFTVNSGQYGVVISNPYTRRITGNLYSGCTDSPTVTAFTSDSRTNQTFSGGLTWVAGPIRLCNSTTYPVPYCVGTGTHE